MTYILPKELAKIDAIGLGKWRGTIFVIHFHICSDTDTVGTVNRGGEPPTPETFEPMLSLSAMLQQTT